MIYGYIDERVGVAAGRLAVRLSTTWSSQIRQFDFDQELERFLLDAERYAFGPSTQALVDEAASRDIPYIRLNSGSLVQFGQVCINAGSGPPLTSQTSALAVDIALGQGTRRGCSVRGRSARATFPGRAYSRASRAVWPNASAAQWS